MHWKGYSIIIGAIIVITLGIYLATRTGVVAPTLQKSETDIPPLTPEIKAMLAKSKGFATLISYTDSGFEPVETMIKQGEAVRFTNNSSNDLWIAAASDGSKPIYPGTSDCGASALDTCHVLKPREFWEFTFDKSGTWSFRNNLDKGKTGTVLVQVTR